MKSEMKKKKRYFLLLVRNQPSLSQNMQAILVQYVLVFIHRTFFVNFCNHVLQSFFNFYSFYQNSFKTCVNSDET